jgi:hypothetical protein
VVIWAALFLAAGPVHAGGAFEDLGYGARPVALGRAFVALANDPNALFYNPAGLGGLRRPSVTTMYARLFTGLQQANLNLGMAGAILPLGPAGTFGAAITNFSFDSYSENMLYLGYGRQFGSRLAIGGTLRLLRWQADGYDDPVSGLRDNNFAYTGYSVDAGLIYDLGAPSTGLLYRILQGGSLRFGLYATNLNQPNVSDSGVSGAVLPRGVEGGLAYQRENVVAVISISRREKMTRLQAGVEVQLANFGPPPWNSTLFGRVGGVRLMSEGKGGEFDVGVGFVVRRIVVDYVYVYSLALRDIGASHKISFGYTL